MSQSQQEHKHKFHDFQPYIMGHTGEITTAGVNTTSIANAKTHNRTVPFLHAACGPTRYMNCGCARHLSCCDNVLGSGAAFRAAGPSVVKPCPMAVLVKGAVSGQCQKMSRVRMGAFTSPHNIVLASVQTGLPTRALLTQLGAYCVKRLARLAITCSYEETAPSSFSQRIGQLIQRTDVAFDISHDKDEINNFKQVSTPMQNTSSTARRMQSVHTGRIDLPPSIKTWHQLAHKVQASASAG